MYNVNGFIDVPMVTNKIKGIVSINMRTEKLNKCYKKMAYVVILVEN